MQSSPQLSFDASAASDARLERTAAVLSALGHKLRLELWCMLVSCGAKGLSAGSIAARVAAPPSSVSFHLQQMKQAGILKQRRSSRQMIYSIDHEVVDAACSFLSKHPTGQVIKLPRAAPAVKAT